MSEDKYFEDEGVTKYYPIPMTAQLKRMWRRSDLYALPVTLRYKGEKAFYTNFGALTSCIIMFVMIGFVLTYVNVMLSNSIISTTEIERLEIQKPDSDICLKPSDCIFRFGFKLVDSFD
jgi:large-conductance mechanosensitive channel